MNSKNRLVKLKNNSIYAYRVYMRDPLLMKNPHEFEAFEIVHFQPDDKYVLVLDEKFRSIHNDYFRKCILKNKIVWIWDGFLNH